MAPPQKGKQATKGAKQIVEENAATLSFYRNMALGSSLIFVVMNYLMFEFTMFNTILTTLAIMILFASYKFMSFMCKSEVSATGAIIDSGTDLNMEGGIAEHVKDLIILTSGTVLLSLVSNYFWLLLLLAPARALWMLWGSVIKPWLAQKEEQPEVDEKKQKKMERKMKRMR